MSYAHGLAMPKSFRSFVTEQRELTEGNIPLFNQALFETTLSGGERGFNANKSY